MTPRIVAIVQARMGSSRLPGKVMLDLLGEPMVARVVDRTARSALVEQVIVATTTDPADDVLQTHCGAKSIACWRGSQYDVLDRYHGAANAYGAEIIVRITADCPLIDAGLIDEAIRVLAGFSPNKSAETYGVTQYDFAANRLPPPWKRTYPIGLDTEVCTFAALEKAWREAAEPQQREHVMPYLYEGVVLTRTSDRISSGLSGRGFRVGLLDSPEDYGHYRWTVDTAEDLEFARQVYAHFGGRTDFSWHDVLELLQQHPDLAQINAGVRHKTLGDIDARAGAERGL